jgi:integrase
MARLRKFGWSNAFYIVWSEGRSSRRVSAGTSDRKEAERALARFEALQAQPPDTFDVNAIIDGYLADRKPTVRAYATLAYSLAPIRLHFGLLPPRLINRALVRAYIAKRRHAGRANATIDKELRTLRQALGWAVKEQWITQAPYIDTPGGGAPRQRWLTRTEADKLIAATDEPHIKLFCILGLHTGARCAAVLSLTWDRVDFDRGLVIFPPAAAGSRKRTAIIPMNATLRAALEEACEFAETDWAVEYRGRPITRVTKGFKRAVERSGIPACTIHDLRRTCASWLLQEGASFAQVAAYLGDTEDMIRRHYGQFSPDWLRAAAASLDQ